MTHPTAHPEPGFIQADVTTRRAEDGGRRAAIRTGYRPTWPNWWLPAEAGHAWAGGTVELVHRSELAPASSCAVRIYPFLPEEWVGIAVGSSLELCAA